METLEKQNLIIKKLIENNWEVEDVSMKDRCEIIATNKYAKISITTEECLCHGGRMWIESEHTKNHFEISHSCYDESLGITDSSSELKYIIENEMMEYINKLSNFIYKLVKINEYGNKNGCDNEDVRYYADMGCLCRTITEEDISDIFMIEEVKHQYPNKNIFCVTKRIRKEEKYSWEKGRLWFEQTRYERKDEKSEFEIARAYEMYVDIFNK